jgi:hypothetical protein
VVELEDLEVGCGAQERLEVVGGRLGRAPGGGWHDHNDLFAVARDDLGTFRERCANELAGPPASWAAALMRRSLFRVGAWSAAIGGSRLEDP